MASKILFIGGVGCSGKTALSTRIMAQANVPFYSIDHLMMGLYRSQSDCQFSPMDDAVTLSKQLWPIVKAMAEVNLENQHSLIFEGFQLQPKDVKSFADRFPSRIESIFLVLSESYIRKEYHKSIAQYRSCTELRDYNQDSDLNKLVNDHQQMRGLCIQARVRFLEIEERYEEAIAELAEELSAKIRLA